MRGPLEEPRYRSTVPDFEADGDMIKKSSNPSSLISPAEDIVEPNNAFAEVPFFDQVDCPEIGPSADHSHMWTLPE